MMQTFLLRNCGKVCWLLAAACCLSGCQGERAAFSIVKRIPHDNTAFTQGLLVHNGVLFESTGKYGHSSLRRLDIETGEILQQVNLPPVYFAEGLALIEDRLIQLTWKEGTAWIYDVDTFKRAGRFRYHTEGWGLTHDGRQLIMSDGSAMLYFRSPQTFEIVRSIEVTEDGVPVRQLNELEYIQDEIWANVYQTNYIVRIDPESGRVKQRMDFGWLVADDERNRKEDVLNGIAWDVDQQHLYLTGKRYSFIYQLRMK